MLNMRSVPRDVTARTAIRDAALRLFGEYGIDGVSIRQIATAAEVSPALVLHHFGSKEGLRADVDAHVLSGIERFAHDYGSQEVGEIFAGHTESVVSAMGAAFPPDSPELAYIPRLLVEGGDVGRAMFKHWHDMTVRALAEWEAAGVVSAGPDPQARAAFMLTADLGLMLLRNHATAALGTDPLGDGLARWTDEVIRIYGGMFTAAEGGPDE